MMCLGIPGLVTEFDGNDSQYAWVDVGGARRRVNVALLTDGTLRPGDWVLIHVGFALARIDEGEAHATLCLLEGMEKAYVDELQAMARSEATSTSAGTTSAGASSAGSVDGPASFAGPASSRGDS
jgi:hydrogenase expression/formation protein HypC